jgi:DNA-binding NtrC family response regulator
MAHRLLIVDDEAPLADLLKRYLDRQGYEVDACNTAEYALDLVNNGSVYDMVITDLTLNGLNGEDLIDRLRERIPGLPGILASGYPHVPRAEGVEFLQKPFLPKMLLETLQKMLGAPAPTE